MSKLKREEVEKQEQAVLCLAKQIHNIAMRKKEPEIQITAGQLVTADLNETELMYNRSLFSHHSSELNLLKDRGSNRSQYLVQDWVNSFPLGNSLTAAIELILSRPGSLTVNHPL